MNKLQELGYEIIYCPGKLNNTADFLSRDSFEARENVKDTSSSKISSLEIKSLDLNFEIDWEKEQQNDKEIAMARLNIENKATADWRELKNHKFWRKNVDMSTSSF